MARRIPLQISLFSLITLLPVLASAHINVTDPPARNSLSAPGTNSEGVPCGTGSLGQAPTVYQAGQEIEVKWFEAVSHTGTYRISLATSEDEFTIPNANDAVGGVILAAGIPDICDVNGNSCMYSQTITLPSEPCESCILQVTQDSTEAGKYYMCSDIIIEAADGGGSGGADGGGGTDAGAGGMDTGVGGDFGVNTGGSSAGGFAGVGDGAGGAVTGTGSTDSGAGGAVDVATGGAAAAVGAGGVASGGADGAAATGGASGDPGAAPAASGGDGYGLNESSDDSAAESGCSYSASNDGGNWSWLLLLGLAPMLRRRRSSARA